MRSALFLFLPIAVMGCFPGEDKIDVFTEEEFEIIKQFGPLGDPPPMPANKYADDPVAAAFGQRLFFEKGYAGPLVIPGTGLGNVGDAGKVSCESCHDAKNYFTDTRSRPNATSVAIQWQGRNSPSMVNSAYYTWGGWGGKNDSIWSHAMTVEVPVNFAGNRLQYAHLIYAKYKADYEAVFPPLDPALDPTHPDAARFPCAGKPKANMDAPDGPWELMAAADRDHVMQIVANTAKAFEAYIRRLSSKNAPIDRYVAGDHDALTPAQKRGLALFIGKAACVDCHSGPTFSDQGFHNTGVPQFVGTAAAKDTGRFQDTTFAMNNAFGVAGKYSDDVAWGTEKLAILNPTDDLKGLFRTKSLRHVEKTGPYMHNGSLATLEDVVHFYNVGGGTSGYEGTKHAAMVPLYLTSEEEADLVAFLRALTGENVAMELQQDTAGPTALPVCP